MRWLMLAAAACFGIAIGCAATPTTVFGVDAQAWTSAGLLGVALDFVMAPYYVRRVD
jgi:hypothetical protein